MFHKILIANRGEIASRIIRTCHQLGIDTLAIYAPIDRHMPFVHEARQAVCLGENDISKSYLNADLIFEIAKQYGADAVHPGFGFFAENPDFAQRCAAEGITFIGPSAECIAQMASKKAARQMMQNAGVPVIPGFEGPKENFAQEAQKMGYPVLVKASAGGGGRGMRRVDRPEDLDSAIQSAESEAQKAFGDGTLLLEKYLHPVRHIEVQILGDQEGHVLHLHERECSLQRRYQKVIEEAPAPQLQASTRDALHNYALKVGQTLNYYSLGTVEFAVDTQENIYFLEVNTRIQVEHPVTEAITGLDLVALQIQVAAKKPLSLTQEEIAPQGHAIEARLYAEDPLNDFAPCTGKVTHIHWPTGPGLRCDVGIQKGSQVSVFYDAMLAKLIALAPTRSEALQQLNGLLNDLQLFGVQSNLNFLRQVLAHKDVTSGHMHTTLLHEQPWSSEALPKQALCAALLSLVRQRRPIAHLQGLRAGFRNLPYRWSEQQFKHRDQVLSCVYHQDRKGNFRVKIGEEDLHVSEVTHTEHTVSMQIGREFFQVTHLQTPEAIWLHHPSFGNLKLAPLSNLIPPENEAEGNPYAAQMPGKILKLWVKPGDTVAQNQPLLTIESMKMETQILAHAAGKVDEIYVSEDQMVEAGCHFLRLESHAD